MKTFSYPRPEHSAQRRCPRPLRDLLPLEPLPELPAPPPLSSPPRTFSDPSYILTTHLVPVALPRSTPEVPQPDTPARGPVANAAAISLAREMIALRDRYWDGKLDLPNSTKPLWACVNRYVRRDLNDADGSKGITLVLTHANGYHKEIWEPTILHMIHAQRNSSSDIRVDEIWSWEPWNHGDAALINGRDATCLFDGRDNARDILQFILYYLPSQPSSAALPVHLERLPESVAASRRSRGFEGRQLVGVGHSLGGCSIARLAIAEPTVFSSLILVEAGIVAYPGSGPLVDKRTVPYLVYAIKRESWWPSREEARRALSASPFFSTWDTDALSIYVECGLCDDLNGRITLKMPGTQEAMTYTDMLTMYEAWDMIDTLDEGVEIRWILAGKIGKGEEWFRETTSWRRPMNCSNVVFTEAGHLIVMEAPEDLGKELFAFVERKYSSLQSKL
ncbi:alpha/beta-hydrolase [Fomitopsis serialis]|uniref:alpha/beta-hydrolase n=1 Tax=Fomitopsis serialis TaxID=139415 RepID=UPI002007F9A1|nr:alpha/beta-hydrolase [Neoantrodia serialis]KAH9926153.1 alpha/beta-hydrolase [Neoantrodia serialis]